MAGAASMSPGDRAVRCYVAGWQRFHAVGGLGWLRAGDGFHAAYSGLGDAEFNEVLLFDRCDADEVARALADVAAQGAPYALRARPGLTETAAAIAAAHGLTAGPDVPLMALSQAAAGTAPSGALELRRLGAQESERHVAVTASVFHAPRDLMRALTPPRVMTEPGVHVVGGLLDGRLVTTAVVDVHDDAGWMFNVATLDTHRRHGFGAAVILATARFAIADGASTIFLLSTPLGEPVYARVGFRCIEHWASWSAG